MAKHPVVSEDDLRELTVDELRNQAKQAGISHNADMRKEELVSALVAAAGRKDGADDSGREGDDDESARGAGPDGGHIRRGSETSRSLKYSQEISSPDDEPERPGRSLATTHHDVIRAWAEARGGRPATVDGSEHGDHLGVLRFDFGDDTPNLRHVSWEEWFATFDDRRLNFLYQEEKTDGRQSTFFRLENPEREDA